MGAHIFLVGQDNFDVCIERGVYGCVQPTKLWNEAEIISGIMGIQPNDLVFFYVKNRGVYGVWSIIDKPFFDTTKIWDDDTRTFPYRIIFKPIIGSFPKPVSLNDIFDLRDKGRIWTFDLNPVQQKNQYKITMDEARELLRLLLRNNARRKAPHPIEHPYTIPPISTEITVDLSSSKGSKVKYESWLNAWFVKSLAEGKLKNLLGDYREFISLVPTTFNKVMDIFLTHVETINSIDITYKYTCVELKVNRAGEKDLTQLLRYEDWLARKLASGDHSMIQSVLVAYSFSDEVINYVRNRHRIEEKTVRLITYRVSKDRQTIHLQEEL